MTLYNCDLAHKRVNVFFFSVSLSLNYCFTEKLKIKFVSSILTVIVEMSVYC